MSQSRELDSFGHYPKIAQRSMSMHWRDEAFPDSAIPSLPRGCGRSYGDSCLAPAGGQLLDMRALDRLIAFDASTGILRCESGVTLATILEQFVPRGWLPQVLPGTSIVTVGGAIANDIHGKNHHRSGSFGECVLQFELLRSDGSRCVCSPTQNSQLFEASIGGLGLSGIVTWAEIQLRAIPGPWMEVETLRFSTLDEFFQLAQGSEATHEYTVAWFDCFSARAGNLRGVFFRANHSSDVISPPRRWTGFGIPITPPFSLVGGVAMRAFNRLYFALHKSATRREHYSRFFFPLDALQDWNRVYGPRGLLQFQCVVPPHSERTAIPALLERIAAVRQGSFLAVLKTFGARHSRGTIGFARPGTTLALDFPVNTATLALQPALEAIVMQSGGAIYPAKDASMSAQMFRSGFPQWQEIERQRDRAILSAFWQRVTGLGT